MSDAWIPAKLAPADSSGTTYVLPGARWLDVEPPVTHRWWDGDELVEARLLGWWNGTALRPVVVRGHWDGAELQPLS